MRRMYSVQELSEIVSAVVGQKINDGDFDSLIAQAVNDYIEEHPVDPTAITGLDIAPKDVSASGNITGASIVENMSGYSAQLNTKANITATSLYEGVVKNGNKITFVHFITLNRSGEVTDNNFIILNITIPSVIGSKLYPYTLSGLNALSHQTISAYSGSNTFKSITVLTGKGSNTALYVQLIGINSLTLNTDYVLRIETTFLLNDSLIA